MLSLLPRPLLQGLNIRHTGKTKVFIATNTSLRYYKPPVTATMTFFTSINTMKIYIYTCPMAPTRKRSFMLCPHEASLAKD
jgi:hypothetical protein